MSQFDKSDYWARRGTGMRGQAPDPKRTCLRCRAKPGESLVMTGHENGEKQYASVPQKTEEKEAKKVIKS
jgi:hypothetical protein